MIFDLFYFLKILFLPTSDNEIKTKKDLLDQHSFYYPEASKNGKLMGLRLLKFQIKILLGSTKSKLNFDKVDFVFYTLFPGSKQSDLNLIKANKKELREKKFFAFHRENIYTNLNSLEIYCSILFLLLCYPFTSVFSLGRSNKFNVFLIPESFLISRIFKKVLLKTDTELFFHLYPHEPEGNLSYMLKPKKVEYIKVPNLNPLFMFNKRIISDKIGLTFGYQQDELKAEKSELPFEKWKSPKFDAFLNDLSSQEKDGRVCYYSHASWIRQKEKHGSTWFEEDKMEINLLNYFKSNKDLFQNGKGITVCLHPKEKRSPELLNLSIDYYKDHFGEEVNFLPPQQSSYDSFKLFELGISAFTSIIFERLYCGHKSLIYHDQESYTFPVQNSDYDHFVFRDFQELSLKLHDIVEGKVSDQKFFNGLEKYTYKFV